jgi:hypothetical protein
MRREVIWRTEDGIGAEHLFLTGGDGGFVADSIVFATREVEPSRTHYRVELDPDWSVRRVSLTVAKAGEPARSLELVSDGRGHWQDRHGTVLPDVDQCIDIDISATPFTNTLPIRRLGLQPDQVAPILVLFIHVPTLEVEPAAQRYTGLAPGLVRYESSGTDFRRDLTVDDDGLVIEYPGLFTRVWSR